MKMKSGSGHGHIIQHYISTAILQKTDCNFCEQVAAKVLPLFKIHHLHIQWQEEKCKYFKKRDLLEMQVLSDLKKAFAALKKQLFDNGLLDQLDIKRHVCVIENMVQLRRGKYTREEDIKCSSCGGLAKDHRIYLFPSHCYGIYQWMLRLCEVLLRLGREDLLKDCVEVRYINSYMCDPNVFQRTRCMECGYLYDCNSAPRDREGHPVEFQALAPEWVCTECRSPRAEFLPLDDMVIRSIPYIECTMFSDTYFELESMNAIFSAWVDDPSKAPAWMAFEILSNMGWAFKISRDFIRKKNLHYNDVEECKRSQRLLELHDLRHFINNIRMKKRRRKRRFYNRDYYGKALANVRKALPVDELIFPLWPISIALVIEDHIRLRLKIEWEIGIIEVCELHVFQEGDTPKNVIHKFIENLVKNSQSDSFLDCNKMGSNATKFLRKVGICSVLEKIFIDEKTAFSARLKATCIKLSHQPEPYVRKLIDKIKKLKTVRWGNIKD